MEEYSKKISYTLKRLAKSRRIKISVNHSGQVTVTMPLFVSQITAEKFIDKKSTWILKAQEKMRKYFEHATVLQHTGQHYSTNKRQAYKLITNRIAYFNTVYNFTFKTVKIKNQKSRWGSCSAKGNLNFNYHIISLPQELQDYIIVHELCHLKELNHSPRFWNLVSRTIPDYKKRQKNLRENYVHIS